MRWNDTIDVLIRTYLVTIASDIDTRKEDIHVIRRLVPTLDKLNRTLWLRLLSAFRMMLNARGGGRIEAALLHAAASLEFYRLMIEERRNEEDQQEIKLHTSRNRMLREMGRQFVSDRVLRKICRVRSSEEGVDSQLASTACETFRKATRRLLPFNVSLHVCSWLISNLFRRRALTVNTFLKAMYEALVLNCVVASSCFLWTLFGLKFAQVISDPRQSIALTAAMIPLPLHAVRSDVVRASFFFLYLPWSVRSAIALSNVKIPTKLSLFLGIALTAATPRRLVSSDWLVSVAFRVAQRNLLARSRFGGKVQRNTAR